ncbi:MAG: BatA domain-containing protein, partial [Verrucomicrobiales bacterium]
MSLSNPLGLLALLGIPALLLIHFLQRQKPPLTITTLFLLEKNRPPDHAGHRLDRLRHSLPLWLQILAVLLLTWLLIEPRYPRANSAARIAVVIDASASMQAFRAEARAALAERLPILQGKAPGLELLLLPSDQPTRPLYHGSSLSDALQALDHWQATAGAHSPDDALRLARSRLAPHDPLIHLTDTPPADPEKLPYDTQVLAIGRPLPNAGFTTPIFTEENGQLQLQTLLLNHQLDPATLTWQLEAENATEPPPERNAGLQPATAHPLTPQRTTKESASGLQQTTNESASASEQRTTRRAQRARSASASETPSGRRAERSEQGVQAPYSGRGLAGQAIPINLPWPAETESATLHLQAPGDPFPLDNTLPLVRPRPKTLLYHSEQSDHPLLTRLQNAIPNLRPASTPADADLLLLFHLPPTLPDQPLILLPHGSAPDRNASEIPAKGLQLGSPPIPADHPLMVQLNWQSLHAPRLLPLPTQPHAQTLLWLSPPSAAQRTTEGSASDPLPLITLATTPSGHAQLLLHFHLPSSNALKQSALPLLLLRFCEELRRQKIAPTQANYETRQLLSLAHAPTAELSFSGLSSAPPLRAPATPGHFSIAQDG